jgi:hypothetical protein
MHMWGNKLTQIFVEKPREKRLLWNLILEKNIKKELEEYDIKF